MEGIIFWDSYILFFFFSRVWLEDRLVDEEEWLMCFTYGEK